MSRKRKAPNAAPPPDNVTYPAAFVGKPVIVNPKGQGARKGRLRFCKDLSQHRRWHLDRQQRQREQEESERKRREAREHELANAPNTMELLKLFREILTLLNQADRAHFGHMFEMMQQIRGRPGSSQGPPAA